MKKIVLRYLGNRQLLYINPDTGWKREAKNVIEATGFDNLQDARDVVAETSPPHFEVCDVEISYTVRVVPDDES